MSKAFKLDFLVGTSNFLLMCLALGLLNSFKWAREHIPAILKRLPLYLLVSYPVGSGEMEVSLHIITLTDLLPL